MKKRRCITLIEIIIVMFLIATITGVIAFNYRGSMEEGKAFKTKAGIEKLHTILTLRAAEDPEFTIERWQEAVKSSPLVHNSSALIHDGWGKSYNVVMDDEGDITITSNAYHEYLKKKGHSSVVGSAQ